MIIPGINDERMYSKSIIRKRNKCYVYIQLCGYSITDGIERSPFAIISAQEIDRPKSSRRRALSPLEGEQVFFFATDSFIETAECTCEFKDSANRRKYEGKTKGKSALFEADVRSKLHSLRAWNILILNEKVKSKEKK